MRWERTLVKGLLGKYAWIHTLESRLKKGSQSNVIQRNVSNCDLGEQRKPHKYIVGEDFRRHLARRLESYHIIPKIIYTRLLSKSHWWSWMLS